MKGSGEYNNDDGSQFTDLSRYTTREFGYVLKEVYEITCDLQVNTGSGSTWYQ
ncbi:MAG: hypothetical protein QF371_09285 [Flavobacteriales bacterium]|nr:hypothetical protein [Flavobacteriales bacterium]